MRGGGSRHGAPQVTEEGAGGGVGPARAHACFMGARPACPGAPCCVWAPLRLVGDAVGGHGSAPQETTPPTREGPDR